MTQYIVSNPEIMSGQPCIVGTRIPIVRILFLIKQGYTLEEIQKHYPHVSMDKFEGVITELAQSIDNTAYVTQVL